MTFVHLKDGVDPAGINPHLLDGLLRLVLLFQQHGYVLVVTALGDGTHKSGSLHYRGYAVDVRSRDIPVEHRTALSEAMRKLLGPNWDVLLEKDHYHIEYDPEHNGGKNLP